ncbi:MAG: hypothetical protein D6712_07145, partial [Chloroflexi bacterium]
MSVKRLFSLLLVIFLAFVLAACGGGGGEESTAEASSGGDSSGQQSGQTGQQEEQSQEAPLHLVHTFETDHMDTLLTLAFSPDGTLLATAGEDHNIHIFELATGRRVQILVGHESKVNA